MIKETGLLKGSVSKAKRKLLGRNIVTQTGNKIGLNKDYKRWKELPKQVTNQKVTRMKTRVTQTETSDTHIETKVSIQRDTIDNKQKILIQKRSVAKATEADREIGKELLVQLINTNEGFKAKYFGDDVVMKRKVDNWSVDIEKLRRIDNMPAEKISMMVEWLFTSKHKDALFWRGNIQSAKKLREHFPKLISAMEREYEEEKGGNITFIS
jgi:hypothetical protein